jgi:hypothetical protein
VRQSLLNRVRKVEATVPLTCRACGRVSTVDRSYTTLVLFELGGRFLKYGGAEVRAEDLRPCPSCGLPKERCGKIIRGVDPARL